MPGFPNLFMLYGPGTNAGELVLTLECAVKRMIRERVVAIEVKPRFEEMWYRWLQSKVERTSWATTNNYFKSPTGEVVTHWPYSNLHYRLFTKVLGRMSETTRRRQ